MNNPPVSVVMIVRNGERFLAQALHSVRAQEYRPLEIIVVDGQSTDRTAEIATSFPEVRLTRQTGRGIADAYNQGITSAQGEIIAFLSHDDLWTPDKLSTQVQYLTEHPETQYCVARVKFFLEEGASVPPGFKRELLEGDHVGFIMETLVARKSLFTTFGMLDARLSISNDTDWFARAKDARIPMAVIPRVLLQKRIHGTNTASNVDVVNKELLEVIKQSLRRRKNQQSGQEEQSGGT